MPFAPHPKRAEFDERLAAGEDAKALADEFGISRETLRNWLKPKDKPIAPPAGVENDNEGGVKAPLTGRAAEKPATKGSGGKRGAKSTISESTAEKLIEGMFMVAAVTTNEPLRLLNDVQKKALGSPFADSLAIVPSPIAQAINTYAAPGIFLTTLFGVIQAQNVAIANRNRARGDSPAARAQRQHTVQVRDEVAAARQQRETQHEAQHEPAGFSMDMDTAAAIAAAKGSLQHEDEADDAEMHFTAV